VSYFTYGEIFLMMPLLLLLFLGYYFCFYSPNVESSGHVASSAIVLTFLAANKSSSIFSLLFGISFEHLLSYHKLAAICALTLGICHTYLVFESNDVHSNVMQFATRDVNNALGSLILLCLTCFVLTSFFPILRRWNYDLWLSIHIGLAVAIGLPWAVHSVNLVWLPLFWFVLDWVVRYGVMVKCRYRTQASFHQLLVDVVEIKFPKPAGLDYNPGQFLRIAIPKLSVFQFHPFSISSAPHEAYVTIHVRASGNWTEQLLQLAKEKQQRSHSIWIEGPYGALSVDLNSPRYGMVLFVCGGTGVTHCRSVLRSLIQAHDVNERRFDKMRFIWAVRDLAFVESLPLFEDRMQQSRISVRQHQGVDNGVEAVHRPRTVERTSDYPFFQTEAYVTSSKESVDEESSDFGWTDRQLVVRKGRPNMDVLVSEMADEALGKGITHVAVFGCGPHALIGDLQEACRKHTKGVLDCEGVTLTFTKKCLSFRPAFLSRRGSTHI
jgi:NADPH oxidase